MEGRWTWLVCVLELLLVACDTQAQTDSTNAVDAKNLIGTSLAMYILIGIAGLYFAITIVCFCIILCTCYCNCKKSRPKRPDEIPLHPREHKAREHQEREVPSSRKKEPNQYKYGELKEDPVSPTVTSVLDIEKAPSVKQTTPRFKRKQLEGEGHGPPCKDEGLATPTLHLHGSPRPSRPQSGMTEMGPHPKSEVAEGAVTPSTSFPAGVPPVALAPVHKTPNLRRGSPRFIRRQLAGDTPTLTPRESPQVSTRCSPLRPSRPTPVVDRHTKTELAEGAVAPSTSFPAGVPPIALAPVYKTPHLRRGSPRFIRRQLAGDTPTLTPRESPQVSTRCSPLRPSRPTPGAMNPGYREESVTLLTLQRELSVISHMWYEVGVHFKVPIRTLNNIKQIVKDNDELCMMRVCEEWVWKEGDPTWGAVVRMLDSKVISETALANSLKDKYCSVLETPDEMPPPSPKLDTSTTWI